MEHHHHHQSFPQLKLSLDQVRHSSYTRLDKSRQLSKMLNDPNTPSVAISMNHGIPGPNPPSADGSISRVSKETELLPVEDSRFTKMGSQPELVARKYHEKLSEVPQNDPKYAFNHFTMQFNSKALEKAYLLHQHDNMSLRSLYPALQIIASALVEVLSFENDSNDSLLTVNWSFGTILVLISFFTAFAVKKGNNNSWVILGRNVSRHSAYIIGTCLCEALLVCWTLIGVHFSLTDAGNMNLVNQCTSDLAFWKFALLLSTFLSIFLMRTPFLLNAILILISTVLVTIYEIYYAQMLGYGWCMSKKLLLTFCLLSGLALISFAEFAAKKQFARWIVTIDSLDLAKSDAVNANQAKRDFLSYIFHEIRVPLSAISIAVDLILQEQKDHSIPRGFQSPGVSSPPIDPMSIEGKEVDDESLVLMIKQQVDTVRHILDDVLSLQKIEEGKFVIEKAAFSVAKMLREVHWAYQKICEQKNVKISLEIAPSLESVEIVGDQYRLRQVLANFVSNALKFVPPQDGSVKIAATEVLGESGKMVEISVRDNGVGISVTDQQKLFKPYIQISAGELQKGRGTGLGLNISKHIIRLHDGNIGVRSLEKIGSKFFFQIPLIKRTSHLKTTNPTVNPPAPTIPSPTPSILSTLSEEKEGGFDQPPQLLPSMLSSTDSILSPGSVLREPLSPQSIEENFKRLKILVVEDNLPNAKLLKRMLNTWGVTVTQAGNGLEAVAKFAVSSVDSSPFDLVLMDKEMPVMQGDEAIRQIRGLGFQLPIVVLTGNGFEEEMENMMGAGADAFLTKPTNADQLKKTIQKYTMELAHETIVENRKTKKKRPDEERLVHV
jgi:signal transduction histidine kinase/FixJ family two-component response regulator